MRWSSSSWLPIGILAGVVLAFVGVALFGEEMARFEWLGTFFLKALKMIIIPLIMATMVVGITGLGDVRKLGRVGGVTMLYYTATTGFSVALGILLVNLFQPGVGVTLVEGTTPQMVQAKALVGWTDIILSFVSDNIVGAMARMEILPVIIFSLVFGGVLTTLGQKGKPVIAFFEGVEAVVMKMVKLIMILAPVGVFGLVAGRFAQAGELGTVLAGLGKYMGTVLVGLALHGLVVLPLILWFFTRRNPFAYLVQMGAALLTAFSTASSSATLPITLDCVKTKAKVSPKAAGFVLPLGATVNMDGTALYEAVAAIFIAQAFGIELTALQQVIIFITATIAAIGAAGIPQAGLVTMMIVLKAAGLPLEGIGLLLSIDWLLDRFRTTVNVWGDSVGAAVVERVIPGASAGGQSLRHKASADRRR